MILRETVLAKQFSQILSPDAPLSFEKSRLTAACLALPLAASAQTGVPSGVVDFSGGSLAAGIGFSWGEGTLTFHGKTYPFTISGFNVGDVGVSHIDARGEVYNLTNLADFDGNYAAAGIGATLAGGGTAMVMQNGHGVVMQVYSTTSGLRLNLGPSGITVTMKK